MKWSGGPIVATARVQGFRQIEECTPAQLRATTVGYRLHDLVSYWRSLPPSFFAVVVYLQDEAWLSVPQDPAARSYGASWIVLDIPEQVEQWLGRTRSLPAVAEQRATYLAPRGSRRRPAIPASLRFQVFRRDNFQCTYCGRRPPEVTLHADHAIADRAGGPITLDNLRTACCDCNLGKGARSLRSNGA